MSSNRGQPVEPANGGGSSWMDSAMSAQGYADAVSVYARNGIGSTLYPGLHYERLATYLQQCSSEVEINQRNRIHGTKISSTNLRAFAHLYHGLGFDVQRRIEIMSPSQLLEELQPHNNLKGEANKLLFLSGQPSARWLATIGGALRVDPEYFQRHLQFFSITGRINYFPLPTLPSSSNYIISLSYFTIGRPGPNNKQPSLRDTNGKRTVNTKDMEAYITSLTSNMAENKGLGNSIVREFHLLASGHWVIEQTISLCVTLAGARWTGIIWVDSSEDLTRGPQGPWSRYMQEQYAYHPDHTTFLPTIQTRPWAALKTRQDTISSGEDFNTKAVQSARILHVDYGKTLDKQLIKQDAFYGFEETFRFCSFSSVQFLNLIESNISSGLAFSGQESWAEGQADIVYMQQILEGQIERLRENIGVIKVRGGSLWPQPRDPSLRQKCWDRSQILEKDYEYLLLRATMLTERCKSKMDQLTAKAMLAESSKAIEQATEVTKLTRLAFLFIPLSFTTSFFGMNLSPLVDPEQPLWIWFVVSIPLLAICFLWLNAPRTFYRGLR